MEFQNEENTELLKERAISLAVAAHMGQRDKAGLAYILHPLRVMMKFDGDADMMIAAVLHDVVEDTKVTLEDIAKDFPMHIVSCVDALTRREGEPYKAYITRLAGHVMARLIKLADIEDNMSRTRLFCLPINEAKGMARRYVEAMHYLNTYTPGDVLS